MVLASSAGGEAGMTSVDGAGRRGCQAGLPSPEGPCYVSQEPQPLSASGNGGQISQTHPKTKGQHFLHNRYP